jgi:hypothetical protein
MRRYPLHTKPAALLTGLVVLLLALSLTSCAAAFRSSPSTVHTSLPTPTPTSRPLRQTYVYMPGDDIMIDGVSNARQTAPGVTISVSWTARAYAPSADVMPITISLLVYGPFASQADLGQAMHLGMGVIGATPMPIWQLALTPVASAQPIHTDTLTTTPFTTTLRLPTSLPSGYYDIALVSEAGTQTVFRGDSPLQVTR